MIPAEIDDEHRIQELAALYRRQEPGFAAWAGGYGVIPHEDRTQVRVYAMADLLHQRGVVASREDVYRCLAAADRVASTAMWLVVHMTYARNVYLDGRGLEADDFKPRPDGHTGGSLNMVPAYAGYLAINALTGVTRSWLMGQGHCVAAIDAANLVVSNLTPAHAARYSVSDEGLTRFVRDFYAYAVRPDGRPESPLGSHVNPYTAGGIMEGGYLGFAELQWVHMPLPGERLVVFLSDGAFEEQRGSDWAPRWWRAEDSGLVAPIMIANGRRIDQRTTVSQQGGVAWLRDDLRLNGFDPIDIDGRDPAAFAWAILEMEEWLTACGRAATADEAAYPLPLRYAIAEAPKGYGFPGAGTNLAHNLPLGANPAADAGACSAFNSGARQLWVPLAEVQEAVAILNNHEPQGRPRERDHALARRDPPAPVLPEAPWRDPSAGGKVSAMEGIDACFCRILQANPGLRPRVGNPDELRSNRLNATLDFLKHRVTAPEPGVAEAVDGGVITALNEEAVVCAALGNKGGINLVVTYEAFAVKMLGAVRQEVIFARHQHDVGAPARWITVPLVLTSHTWENGKNEQSHQDPTMCDALLGEMTDVSRVLFPADWNSAVAALQAAYSARGEIWTMVVAKLPVPDRFTAEQAQELVGTGALRLRGAGGSDEAIVLAAIGAYQLAEVLRASDRLAERGIPHSAVYLLEPGRFRAPRDAREAEYLATPEGRDQLFPSTAAARVFVTHTRPESLLGVVRPLDTGADRTRVLGFINHGGTYNTAGLLFANRCTWAHALAAAAEALRLRPEELLTSEELSAVRGEGDPTSVLAPISRDA
jgi:phosphoketolase